MAHPTPTALPNALLVRTTHDKDGKSVFVPDQALTPFRPFGPQASGFTIFDARASVPVNNMDAIPSFAEQLPRCPPNGAMFGISDIAPGTNAPCHRTESIDYACVLSGEVVLRLDSGEERTLRAGEFFVQQGTNHSWVNNTDEPCRMAFVMMSAEKIVTNDGTVLEETVFKGVPK